MKKNYKKAFDVLLRSTSLWKDRTDPEKREIFKTLNEEANFNYCLKGYKTEIENKPYFENLYKIYIEEWNKTHDSGEPVCYLEWVDNELEDLRLSYRRYLKEAVLEDEGFDESSTEDFWDFCEEEIKNSIWEV